MSEKCQKRRSTPASAMSALPVRAGHCFPSCWANRRQMRDPRTPERFLLSAFCDTIRAALMKYQLRRAALIFAVERHGRIESRDKEIAAAIGE